MLLLLISEIEGRILLPHDSNSILGRSIEMSVVLQDYCINLAFVTRSDCPLFVGLFQHFYY